LLRIVFEVLKRLFERFVKIKKALTVLTVNAFVAVREGVEPSRGG
jgi:hypothetical protein